MPPLRALELRWSTTDPDALAARLRGYGFDIGPGLVLAFPSATIKIEAAPGPADRVEIRDGAEPIAGPPPTHPNGIADVLAVGWATVDRERFIADLAPAAVVALRRDAQLGAFALGYGSGEPRVLVLEPDTEGSLVASLVRSGEGPAAIYFGVAAHGLAAFRATVGRLGGATSTVRPGPLGPSVVLLGGPAWGPHLVVVERGRAEAPRAAS